MSLFSIFATLLHFKVIRILLTCLLLITVRSLNAQDCIHTLKGIISSREGEKLPGATVRLLADEHAVVTDADGSFLFSSLCDGTHQLSIEFIGFQSQVITITLPQRSPIKVVLEPSMTELKEVSVEGERTSVARQSQTSVLLDKTQLNLLHGRPLGESLKEIPGVSAIQTGPAIYKPVIHGLHSQRILILNNGLRQEGQQWGIEHAPEIDPTLASTIEVIKGAETVRYGSDAMGGVIVVNPPPLHEVRDFGGEVNLGLMSNNRMATMSFMLEGDVRKESHWHWRMQGSGKRGGDYHSADYNLSNTGTKELNFSGAIGYHSGRKGMEVFVSSFNTEIGILRAAHTGNLDDLQRSIESEVPWYVEDFKYAIDNPKQRIHHQLLRLKSFFQLNDHTRLNFLYGGQYNKREEFDIRRSGRGTRPALSLSLFSNVIDISADHEKGNHKGSIGVNGTVKFNSNDTDLTGIRPLIPNYQQASGGIFILEKIKRGRFDLEAGARYDYQFLKVLTFDNNQNLLEPVFNFNYLNGTVGFAYHFNPSFRFISNLGYSSRPPHVSEIYSEGLHHGTVSIEEGLMRPGDQVLTDQDVVKKETSAKWISTFQYGTEKLTFDASLYYNRIDNYVYVHPYETRLTIRGYFPVFRFDQTDGLLRGVDASVRWNIHPKLSYTGKASYIHAKDVTHDEPLLFIPPAQIDNGLTVHFGDFSAFEDVDFTVNAPYTFKQTRAPRVVYPEDIAANTSEGVFDLAPAPAGYLLLNAQLSFTFPVHEHELNISFAGENILNKNYRNYMNRLRYFAAETGANFILRATYNFTKH